MKAYGIFDGGGAKGAAFAGCLQAASDHGIEFVAYGGTSAGSIAALLASMRYTPQEIEDILIKELTVDKILDQPLAELEELRKIPESMSEGSFTDTAIAMWRSRGMLRRISSDLGLNSGDNLTAFLVEKIQQKLPDDFARGRDTTFEDLKRAGCLPLKILASDLGSRCPIVFSTEKHLGFQVIDAVRASLSYPIVYRPVLMNDRRLVDGGLSCNLPVALFELERKSTNHPVIAFDLVSDSPQSSDQYKFPRFVQDMAATAIDSVEEMLLPLVEEVFRVEIKIPNSIATLDFDLSVEKKQTLREAGYSATRKALDKTAVKHWAKVKSGSISEIQALLAPPSLVETVLNGLLVDVEKSSGVAESLRANIMVPNSSDTIQIVYSVRMADDSDLGIILAKDGGCAGKAFSGAKPMLADLSTIQNPQDGVATWNMTAAEQNQVEKTRQTVFSVPIFADNIVRGALTVDTASPIDGTGWKLKETQRPPIRVMTEWADIAASVLFK